jgi:hypothetical protein
MPPFGYLSLRSKPIFMFYNREELCSPCLAPVGWDFLLNCPMELVFSKEKTKAEFRSTTPCGHPNRGLAWLILSSGILKPVVCGKVLVFDDYDACLISYDNAEFPHNFRTVNT